MTSDSEGRDGITYMGWLSEYLEKQQGAGLTFSGSYYSSGTRNDLTVL